MKYYYEAITDRGLQQVGSIKSPSRSAAVSKLKGYGLYVMKVKARLSTEHYFNHFSRFLEIVIFFMIAAFIAKVVLPIIM